MKVTRQYLLRLVLKNTPKYGKKIKHLLNIKFDTEPVYDDNKHMKTNIKTYHNLTYQNFMVKKFQKKIHNKKVCHL